MTQRDMTQQGMTEGLAHGTAVVVQGELVHLDHDFATLFGFDSLTDLHRFTASPLELIAEGYQAKVLSLSADESFLTADIFFTTNRFGRTIALFVLLQRREWQNKSALEIVAFDISTKVSPHQLINKSKYERLVKNSQQGVVIHRNFTPLFVNQTWADLMGVKEKERFIEEGNILDVIPKEHHVDAIKRCKQVMSGEIVGESHVLENIRMDGEKRYFNIYDHVINWEGEPAVEVVMADVTDEVLAQKELAYRAAHDSLTGLLNRDALYRWINEREEAEESMCCILIDIDNFKNINDTHGHEFGDTVLKEISSIIQLHMFDGSVAGRWGGEEFIIFVPGAEKKACLALAENIRASYEVDVYQINDTRIKSTVSIGVSFTSNFSTTLPKDLVRAADEKMYWSKACGKNRIS